MLELIRPLGLALAVGYWDFGTHPTPASDIRACLEEGHYDWPKLWPNARSRPKDPLKQTENWARGLLRVDQPQTFSMAHMARRGEDQWDVSFSITPVGYGKPGAQVEPWADDWGELLERLGERLYPRLRPTIALIVGMDDNTPEFLRSFVEGRLSVGWRSWYGPRYVERYGRDWLRGLPDRTSDLADGGVAHALAASAADVITSQDVYAPIWPYLEESGVEPFWPRKRRRVLPTAAKDRGLPNLRPT